jgi:DNA polymerase-3 subunit gamma/tau
VAIAQALPDAVDNGQGDRDRVLALAEVLPAEDVQFYYQMGLIGRRDLPLAPDPRSGFEMVLLRMLAFRPAGSGDGPRVALKPLGISQATADPRPNPVAGTAVAVSAVTAAVVEAETEPGVAAVVPEPSLAPQAPTPVESEPAVSAPPVVAAAPTAAPPAAIAAVTNLPWEEQAAPVEVCAPLSVPPQAEALAVQPASIAPPVEASSDSDDEPPLGDYDYVEMDAQSFDYDFDAVDSAASVEPELQLAAKPATGLAADWLELFPKLGLSGMTGSIGANCTLMAVEGDSWLLHLDPGHSALFNATQQRRLNDALNQYHGRELHLQIELCTPEQETPAQAAARKRANRQREAEESIHGDPLVQQMIQQFAAVIRADSIEPVDTQVNSLITED